MTLQGGGGRGCQQCSEAHSRAARCLVVDKQADQQGSSTAGYYGISLDSGYGHIGGAQERLSQEDGAVYSKTRHGPD